MPDNYDVVVIGGGVVGLSTAMHLARRGARVVVLERRFVAAGATGRSSGLVRMHYSLEAESRLAWASFQYFRDWAERVGGDCGFTRTGFVQIVPPEANAALRANVAMHQRLGIPSLVVSAAEVRLLAPSFAADDFELAAYEPESGYADPSATAQSLADAARAAGARLAQECPVTAIHTRGGRVTGVSTPKGEFAAPWVVNAAGAWAADVAALAGLRLPLTTWTHAVAYVRRPPEVRRHPTLIDDVLSMYLRPETGGLTLVGLEDQNAFGLSPDTDTERAPAGFAEQAVERLLRRMPALEAGSLKTAHTGHDGLTPDQRPMLGPAGPDGFYLACGFSGTGFKLGPAVGACVAEALLEGAATTADVGPFDPGRFERGQLLTSDTDYGVVWK